MIEMTEAILVEKASGYLSKFFDVQIEVWSTDYKKRIDMVLIHKSDTAKKYPIGIEFKQNGKKRGKELGLWLEQSMTYSQSDFINYGKLLVCTYPQVTGLYLNEGDNMCEHSVTDYTLRPHNNINTFLAHFKIGELQKMKKDGREYFMIVFNAQVVWDGTNDDMKYDKLEKLWQNL